jgi:hypothetical protein
MDEKERLRISGKIHGVGVYRKALESARSELARLAIEREKIARRMAALERMIEALVSICQEDGVSLPPDFVLPAGLETASTSAGLTDAIKDALRRSDTSMTPTEVRDKLLEAGFDLKRYASPLVPIHNTLKRLYDQGEIARTKEAPIRYQWLDAVAKSTARGYGATNSLANMLLRRK